MVVFLANRTNLQRRRLHDRIRQRLAGEFDAVRMRRAEPQEPGPYRVVAELNPRPLLDDETYPVETARIEIGFQLQTGTGHEHYWFNWIEPDRDLLVGWHQDDTHEDLGPVHLQVSDGPETVARHPAQFIDAHPLAVVERRRHGLRDVVAAVEWDGEGPVGLDSGSV